MYSPIIDDPSHIALLEGQCYVVLRVGGAARDAFANLQMSLKQRLAGQKVSFPAQPHVTLLGLARGTPLPAALELVASWAPDIPPLRLTIQGVGCFPTPHRIVMVQIQKTPDLAEAMSSLRASARRRGLRDLAAVAPLDWIFHMSLGYCTGLDDGSWVELEPWITAAVVPRVESVVSEVEIVTFDHGRETSSAVIPLSGQPPQSGAGV